MAGQINITTTLRDENGVWYIRGRICDSATGETYKRGKSTGLKVKDNTKRKAEQVMKDVEAEWEFEAELKSKQNAGDKFSIYVDKFIERKRALRKKASSIKSYEDYNSKHIKPNLGDIPIGQITIGDIEKFYSKYLKTHKVNSARKVHCVISGAFKEAIRDGVIQTNIAENIEFPKAEKYTGADVYDEKEVSILLDGARKAGEPICAAITLAVCYGLRRSEAVGLRWKDIDFDANTLTISNTVTQNGKLRIEAEDTKTSKSHRTIALIPATVSYFEDLKKRQANAGLELDKVCAWQNGSAVRPDYIYKKSKDVMKKAGLKEIRFHDLRHTAASLLARHVSPKQLQEFLGHENISTTFGIYTHVLDEQRVATSNEMSKIIFKDFCPSLCPSVKTTD